MSHSLVVRRRAVAAVTMVLVAMCLTPHGSASRLRTEHSNRAARPQETPAYKLAISKYLEKKGDAAGTISREVFTTATALLDVATDVVQSSGTEQVAASPNTPLSQEAIRIWMESYNAGPYACLRFKGRVPYRETRDYTPKVMRYYQQDLSDNPYDRHIVAAAEKYWLDPQLIRAVMKAESDFRPRLKSHAGARGVMQVMPVVWKEIRNRYDLDWVYHRDVWVPEKNIEVACAYLAWLRYDFLPKHFEAFEKDPVAPPAMIRQTALRASSPRIDTTGLASAAANRGSAEELAESISKAISKVMAEADARNKAADRRQARDDRSRSNRSGRM